jgi:regulatory protein
MDDKARKVLDSLQAQCARREYCVSDIRRKALLKLDGDAKAAEEVVESLVADQFVSDLRYASAFAREKSSLSGWGPVKIRFALSGKGIARQVIDEAIGGIDTEKAAGRLRQLLESKWKTLADDPQGKLKLIKFALSRGYDYDAVRQSVDDLTS